MPRGLSRIFVSDSIPFHAAQRGVARYFRNIVDGIVASFGERVTIFSPERRAYGLARYVAAPRFRGSYTLRVHDILASMLAWREQPAVFYSPYYGRTWTSAPQVFTVHDMIYELLDAYIPKENVFVRRFIAEKRRCIEQAALLIAVSEHTKKDILACYPDVAAQKIVVIHHGVDALFFERDAVAERLDERPYFLFVGQRGLYKNFLRFLAAFGEAGLARDFDVQVISPVGAGFSSEEIACIERYRLQSCVHLVVAASDSLLRQCYARAVALVYPSEYEGFGFPVLEAMASGTLVATSNVSSIPEVGGDAAIYFDPCNVESIAATLLYISRLTPAERHERICRGVAHARTFTWERCQQQTVAVIRRFVDDRV